MTKILRSVLPGVVAALTAGSAVAAPGSSWLVRGDNTVPGTVANNLIADGEGTDWTAAVLVIDVSGSSGSIHNGAPDSMRPQDGFWGFFPDLQWDTWVGTVPSNAPGANDVGPLGAGDLGSPVLSMAGQLVSVTWGGTSTAETGPTQIANITTTNDAQGTWQLLTSFAGGLVVQSGGVWPVPEPATLTLLSLGGLAVLRRRS